MQLGPKPNLPGRTRITAGHALAAFIPFRSKTEPPKTAGTAGASAGTVMAVMHMSKEQLVEAVIARQAELQAAKKAARDGDMKEFLWAVGLLVTMMAMAKIAVS